MKKQNIKNVDEERLQALKALEAQLTILEEEDAEEDITQKLLQMEKSLSKIKRESDPNLDGKVIVEVSPDKIHAYLKITPPKIGGREIDEYDVWRELEREGIKEVKEGVIKNILENKIFDKSFLISEGTPPTDGEDAKVVYKFGDGKFRKAIPGQLLLLIQPPGKGLEGIGVKGEKIPPKKGKEIVVKCGEGVGRSEDGLKFYSTRFGEVRWREEVLSVERTYEVPGDLKRDVNFDGNVVVLGSVKRGVSINASGDIIVKGKVEGEGLLKSCGNISVGLSIEDKKIEAEEKIEAESCSGCQIFCNGLVSVKEFIIDCKIKAEWVLCKGRRGEILGGEIWVKERLDAKEVQKGTTLKAGKSISVSNTLHQGVKVTVSGEAIEIKKTFKSVTFSLEGGNTKVGEYREVREEEIPPPSKKDTILSPPYPSVVVKLTSLREAKKIGACLLGLVEREVDYEIIRGEELLRVFKKGTLGPWLEKEPPIDIDGAFKIENTKDGLFLTVFPPEGKGKKIEVKEVLQAIEEKGYCGIKQDILIKGVDEAKGEPIRIASRQKIPELDGKALVSVSLDGRQASLTLIPAKEGGVDVDFDDCIQILAKNGVAAGIKEDVIRSAIKERKFGTPFVVAEEIPPQPGQDASIDYKFRVDQTKVTLSEDEQGKIDFKELHLIQNVTKGQLLAVKIPATPLGGVPGRKINGEEIPPPPGADIKLPAGKNTEISEDGMKLYATIDGHVTFYNERVNVEQVYELKGDVNLSTGNLSFIGTIVIGGNIEDGFSVRAGGDILVKGGVGKAKLSAQGNIVVGAGVQGKGEGELNAGADIISKFVNSATLRAKRNITITEEVLHSYLDAGEEVRVMGKRGLIIGGRIRAGGEVVAKEIGCDLYTKTLIEVGVKPKIRKERSRVNKMIEQTSRKLERVEANISTLRSLECTLGALSPKKDHLLNRLLKMQETLTLKLRSYMEEKEILNTQLIRSRGGKVSVEKVHPGVFLAVGIGSFEVKNLLKGGVTFTFEGGKIKIKRR